VVNDSDAARARALVETAEEPVVVLDSDRRLVAASGAAAAVIGDVSQGRRVGENALAADPRLLVLFLAALPQLSAYQELRAGFTAAVSHELRTPLARLLVLLERARRSTRRGSSSTTSCSSASSRPVARSSRSAARGRCRSSRRCCARSPSAQSTPR
jgi:signal transduction histidine kinase